jgi:hypothetical protein
MERRNAPAVQARVSSVDHHPARTGNGGRHPADIAPITNFFNP